MSLMKQRIFLTRTGIFSARTATTALLNAPAKVSMAGARKLCGGGGIWNGDWEVRCEAGGTPGEAAWLLLVFLYA